MAKTITGDVKRKAVPLEITDFQINRSRIAIQPPPLALAPNLKAGLKSGDYLKAYGRLGATKRNLTYILDINFLKP